MCNSQPDVLPSRSQSYKASPELIRQQEVCLFVRMAIAAVTSILQYCKPNNALIPGPLQLGLQCQINVHVHKFELADEAMLAAGINILKEANEKYDSGSRSLLAYARRVTMQSVQN